MLTESVDPEVRKDIAGVAGLCFLMFKASAGKTQKLELTQRLDWNPQRASSLTHLTGDASCWLQPQLELSAGHLHGWPGFPQCGGWAPRVSVPRDPGRSCLALCNPALKAM